MGDRSDELQAEANLQVRTLEYQSALNELRSAALKFNLQRGLAQEEVSDQLPTLSRESTAKLSVPAKKGMRLDVKAAQELTKVAEAQAELGKQKNSPTLDLVGMAAGNGRTDQWGSAVSDSWSTRYPTFTLGLKFQTSLDFWQVAENRQAYSAELKSAELNYRRKALEEAQEYQDLVKKFNEGDKVKKLFSI